MIRTIHIRPFELGLRFHREAFAEILKPGDYTRFDPFGRERIELVDRRTPWLIHDQLDVMIASGQLEGLAEILDLTDRQRGLVWIDGRFDTVLPPGRYALWTGFRKIRTELIETAEARFEHPDRDAIVLGKNAAALLDIHEVPKEHAGVLFLDGRYIETLQPGKYAFWKRKATAQVVCVDRREQALEVPGQDVLTADRVTLRLTAVGTYRTVDPVRCVTAIDNAQQLLYREVQLAIRTAVGTRTLDALLAEKDVLSLQLAEVVKPKVAAFGLELTNLGVRDLILPGEMKALLNKVVEARTAAEAAVITRREEAAALRHQANAAKLLQENPTLLKLRELEAVERIAAAGKMNLVLGERGLMDRVVNLL